MPQTNTPAPVPAPHEKWLLLLILALGAWLRFQNLGAIELNIDQAYPLWQAMRTLHSGELPLVGQGTSVLFANPALTGYLFLPLLALVGHPVAGFLLTLTLNSFAVWLAYRGLAWLLGSRPALLGAALFALNPWIIEDSRRTWVQSLMPFFVCLVFWLLVPVLLNKTRHPFRRTLLALLMLALFANTYLLAYALAAPVGLLLLLFWRRIPKKALALGAACFLLLLGVYGLGLFQQREATRSRSESFAAAEATLSDSAVRHSLRLVTGWNYAAERGQNAPAQDAAPRERVSMALHWLWMLALLAGLLQAGRALYRRDEGAGAALILLLWGGLPILMMSYVSQVVHPFYLLLGVPALHGLFAWGLRPWLHHPQVWRGVLSLLLLTGLINGLNVLRFAQESAAHPSAHLPETPTFAAAMEIGTLLNQHRGGGSTLYSTMPPWTPQVLAGEPFTVMQIAPVHFYPATLIAAEGALYMQLQRPGEATPIPPLLAAPAGELRLQDGGRVLLYENHPARLQPQHPRSIPSDLGIRFMGWTLSSPLRAGESSSLLLYWRIDSLQAERGIWAFAPFAHLLDADGQQLAVYNGEVLSPLTWQQGDWWVQQFSISVPAAVNAPALRVGFYDSVRGLNAIFVLPDGSADPHYSSVIPLEPEPPQP